MTKGKASSVKGFTYEFTSSGNATVFSADVKENAEVWFRRYNNPAAFDAAEKEYGTAASFAGQDAPTISPSSGSSDTQSGELFSVSQMPDGTVKNKFSSVSGDMRDITWDGQYYWFSDNAFSGSSTIYRIDETGAVQTKFSAPTPSPTGITWDGKYIWISNEDGSGSIYQLKTDGTEVKSFSTPRFSQGLGYDGTYLYSSSATGGSFNQGIIYKLKTDGTRVDTFLNYGNIRGVCHDGKYIWYTSNTTSRIYRIKGDGTFVESFDAPAGNSQGVTWTGKYLSNSARAAQTIYDITGSNSLDISYRYSEVA